MWISYYMIQFDAVYGPTNIVSRGIWQNFVQYLIKTREATKCIFPQSSNLFMRYSLRWLCIPAIGGLTCEASFGHCLYPRALSYYSDLTLSQEFQPMAAQLSMKAALPLVKILVTASCRSSKTWFAPSLNRGAVTHGHQSMVSSSEWNDLWRAAMP